jgi:peroxiredoxin Q/BCP
MLQMLLPLVLAAAADPAMRPAPGDSAPAFSLQASTGKTISLAEFKGKSAVVLAFFPKAFTGG